ncbi:hypothetical protein OsJ_27539 [Oryza sativa Japonica Group]|uniref:Uncharacterized protein n=1 Tax=Oryza sativa subsp. japonica TaxID=39947 RepID=A3BTR1_ORYSJ|nr:hypothetical protein OsJ_27539 [Oryza sativa Japonica Group]
MGKGGGLSKLRCMIRRWHSSSRIARAPPSAGDLEEGSAAAAGRAASFHGADKVPKGLHPVYFGNSRRRYRYYQRITKFTGTGSGTITLLVSPMTTMVLVHGYVHFTTIP